MEEDLLPGRLRGSVPGSETLQHALDEGYDLLVLGTHVRKGIARLFPGSVAQP